MIGAGMILRALFSRAGLGLAVAATLAAGWFYVQGLRADLQGTRDRMEAVTLERDAARDAAQRAVDRAREAQERERETQSKLDDRLDVVRRSADVCLDQPLPGALFE
jgi:predicted Holliday junction resolvase-like endonuclease